MAKSHAEAAERLLGLMYPEPGGEADTEPGAEEKALERARPAIRDLLRGEGQATRVPGYATSARGEFEFSRGPRSHALGRRLPCILLSTSSLEQSIIQPTGWVEALRLCKWETTASFEVGTRPRWEQDRGLQGGR